MLDQLSESTKIFQEVTYSQPTDKTFLKDSMLMMNLKIQKKEETTGKNQREPNHQLPGWMTQRYVASTVSQIVSFWSHIRFVQVFFRDA